MIRLTSDIWVAAYLRRLQLADIPAYVMAKGDATAGAIIVKLSTLDGTAQSFHRTFDANGTRVWAELARGSEAEIDASLRKQRQFDPDLWIIEVEDKSGRHLLDEDGLAE